MSFPTVLHVEYSLYSTLQHVMELPFSSSGGGLFAVIRTSVGDLIVTVGLHGLLGGPGLYLKTVGSLHSPGPDSLIQRTRTEYIVLGLPKF
jgi:hypothetical protein